ncbi:hypothetical protein SPBR_05684 [Sporothrix brasiliensis 5110]|uniref:AAA protein C-terminal winged helix domain-containing protein n=1 Tax=Sporothrix brasiliensis 5110 TaxID=1398154 RepID=A0A0C2FU27_9PEZI|nr:uncharacterized protein SPBR_05684 [Sporothrix brasiliensis 5110]KIH94513.1 hypothetical protein SPBR_05684 [Sporothrix brasiliensis 5110]
MRALRLHAWPSQARTAVGARCGSVQAPGYTPRQGAAFGIGTMDHGRQTLCTAHGTIPDVYRLRAERNRSRIRRCYSSSAPTPPPSEANDSRAGSNSKSQQSRHGDSAGSGSCSGSLGAKMLESAATSLASILMLALGFGAAGYGYHRYYKHLVLRKMVLAFEPGDPVLELASMGRGVPQHLAGAAAGMMHAADESHDLALEEGEGEGAGEGGDGDDGRGNYWIERPEQKKVNDIVSGREIGHYHLFIGEKGTGKSSMQLEAMAQIDGEGVSMFDAHADLEIFRIRLGKALNYEFNEDYIGGYFSERGPRESTALLDIERALNKLEKVALRRRNRTQAGKARRPLVVIVNQMHLIRDDDDGRDLIELLQQRAEQWAAAGLVTMVFNSDDYWVYERLKQLAARMEVHSIQDLARHPAMVTLQRFRWRYFGERVSNATASEIYDHVGGRLTFLNRVARSSDMLATCRRIIDAEKTWFLNQCWVLGGDMDDDVMDQQKWAAAAMVLAQALVDKEAEEAAEATGKPNAGGDEEEDPTAGTAVAAAVAASGAPGASGASGAPGASGVTAVLATHNSNTNDSTTTDAPVERRQLPSFALHEAQQIMTRADFVREMDRRNLFTIASNAQVRASSVPMQEALRQICGAPGFRQHLDATVQRIADIESLGRTRELVAKDLVLGGRYELSTPGAAGAGLLSSGKGASKKTEVRFRGWSPHERPPRDQPEPGTDDDT